MRTVALVLVVFAILLPAVARADHFPALKLPDGFGTRIEAGRGIGNLRVGMPMSDAKVVLGRAGELIVREFENGSRVCIRAIADLCVADFWKYGDEEEYAYTPRRVLVIGTEDPVFKTAEGLAVHSRPSAFILRFGSPEYEGGLFLEWWKQGIAIVSQRGQAMNVYVVKPR